MLRNLHICTIWKYITKAYHVCNWNPFNISTILRFHDFKYSLSEIRPNTKTKLSQMKILNYWYVSKHANIVLIIHKALACLQRTMHLPIHDVSKSVILFSINIFYYYFLFFFNHLQLFTGQNFAEIFKMSNISIIVDQKKIMYKMIL